MKPEKSSGSLLGAWGVGARSGTNLARMETTKMMKYCLVLQNHELPDSQVRRGEQKETVTW